LLGSGVGNESTPGASRVSALAVSDNDLFAGGTFESAGVSDSGYIARWNDQIDFTPPLVMRLSSPQMLPGNNFKFRVMATERPHMSSNILRTFRLRWPPGPLILVCRNNDSSGRSCTRAKRTRWHGLFV
jgi:hypothetical protein